MKHRKPMLQNILIPKEKLREAMELYSGKTREEVQGLVWKELQKKLLLGMVLSALLIILSLCVGKKETGQEGIQRPFPGSNAAEARAQLLIGEEWKTVEFPIGALEYEEEELEQLHREAERYLATVVTGSNESISKVTGDLYFPDTMPEQRASISWSTDTPWLVTSGGEVRNEELTERQEVEITATLLYGSEARYFHIKAMIYPREYTPEEKLLRQVSEKLREQEEATRTKECFVLPEQVQGYPVRQTKQNTFGVGAFLICLSAVVPILFYFGYFETLDTKRKERKEQAEESYTEFVTQISILLAAGISVRQAFFRLEEEYKKQYGAQHVIAAELQITRQELENGRSEAMVYEAFGRRIGVLAYRRMVSLLEQNTSKGIQGIRSLLLQEAKEVMAEERAKIKIKGEQAGTKLLFPMTGLLFLVFAVLLMPAFQSL